MEWYVTLSLIFGSLIALMLTGLPVAFCFMLLMVVGGFFLWGGEKGILQVILSLNSSLASFTLVAIPLFILMGEACFMTGVGGNMIAALDKWLGRMPGRLGLLTVLAGAVFGAVSGASAASVALLGSTLVPEMKQRGYKAPMILGPILGAGPLDIMIPPSSLCVVLGAIAGISIGKLLIAIIIPGVMMAAIYAIYIILRCKLQPSIAPPYVVPPIPLSEKVTSFVKYVLPLAFVIFACMGLIFLGIATATEAAAAGALTCFILAAAYGKLNWAVAKKSIAATMQITVMCFMIIAGAVAFSQLLAFTGVTRGLAVLATTLPLAPIGIIIAMQIVLLILGCFLVSTAMIMICSPIFMPVVLALGFDPVWFGVLFLLNLEIGTITPPYGTNLFVMKGVAPEYAMKDIMLAAGPFVGLNLIAMTLILAFPGLALWLPNMMMKT